MKLPPRTDDLPRSFYGRPTVDVARALVGKALLRQAADHWIGGLIVETEAYLADGDAASHSARGRTRSNASMFAAPGTLYVYPIHARYCLNVATWAEGIGEAVLIRAIEPVWGLPAMRENRGLQDLRRLTRGPAMLCQALQVDRAQDGADLIGHPELRIAKLDPPPSFTVISTPRIGIRKSAALPYRFAADRSPFLSRGSSRNMKRATRLT
jgi:DNA-3-methyladenine glycosylase